jgi:hypothetical protein
VAAPSTNRVKIAYAVTAAVVLAIVVTATLLLSNGDGDSGPGVPEAELEHCVDLWNADRTTRRDIGAHLAGAHGYRAARVLVLSSDLREIATDAASGHCAVIFLREGDEYELFLTVLVYLSGRWEEVLTRPDVDQEAIIAIRNESFDDSNARLDSSGAPHAFGVCCALSSSPERSRSKCGRPAARAPAAA